MIDCPEVYTQPTPLIRFYTCTYPDTDEYRPVGYSVVYPVGFLVPNGSNLPITLHWDGYGNASNCPTWDGSKADRIVVKNCPDYYANIKLNLITAWGFGGEYLGDSPAQRFGEAVRYIDSRWGSDYGAGLLLEGSSYGASTALLQALMLPPDIQVRVTKVAAQQAVTDFQALYDHTPNVQAAWSSVPDHAADADKLKFIYFFVQGSPADHVVPFDPDWFHDVCDTHRISCYGLWHGCGHALPAPSCAISLPWGQMFAAANQDVRLDDPFIVVFTEASSNIWDAQGCYNCGLSWDSRTLQMTPESLSVALRYAANQYQPATSSVTVTLRPRTGPQMAVGDVYGYTLGGSTGSAVVLVEGEISARITLYSGASETLTFTKTGHIPGC